MDEAGFAARFADATWHCEHHNPDLNYVGKFALSELPRELGFKVVLTGEGSDEHFTGYHIYLPDYLREPDLSWDSGLPEEQRERMSREKEEATSNYYTSIGGDGAAHTTLSQARQKLNNISTPASMSAFVPSVFAPWTSSLSPSTPQDIIAADIPPEVQAKMQHRWHPVNSAQYVWTQRHLPNQFMSCLGDRTEMAHSIEGRTPFLDHELTEFVMGLPPSLKVKWKGDGSEEFTEKYILREAMKPFVTEEIFAQKKHVRGLSIPDPQLIQNNKLIVQLLILSQPYSAPLSYSPDGPLCKLLSSLITEKNIAKLGFVSWDKVKDLVERAFADKETFPFRLALVVAQWVVISERFGVATASA